MRFKILFLSKEINVSSSGHYFARLVLDDNGLRVKRDYCIPDAFLSNQPWGGDWKAPAYLEREVRQRIGALMQSGEARYFEYDRDHNKRFENLRYYDPGVAAAHAAALLKSSTEKSAG